MPLKDVSYFNSWCQDNLVISSKNVLNFLWHHMLLLNFDMWILFFLISWYVNLVNKKKKNKLTSAWWIRQISFGTSSVQNVTRPLDLLAKVSRKIMYEFRWYCYLLALEYIGFLEFIFLIIGLRTKFGYKISCSLRLQPPLKELTLLHILKI